MKKIGDCFIDTEYGKARLVTYKDEQKTHPEYSYAIIFGEVSGGHEVFCRVHSACITAETFYAINCDCKGQLAEAFSLAKERNGVIVYLPQEGRGNGIEAKMKQLELESKGAATDTISAFKIAGYPADNRTYEGAVAILKDLDVLSVELHTASPDKVTSLNNLGIIVTKRIHPKVVTEHKQALKNIKAKQKHLQYYSS